VDGTWRVEKRFDDEAVAAAGLSGRGLRGEAMAGDLRLRFREREGRETVDWAAAMETESLGLAVRIILAFCDVYRQKVRVKEVL
jgi:hypothetical protein